MLVNALQFPQGGRCELTLEETTGWLRAKWSGLVLNREAEAGAVAYLEKARLFSSAYLLNDNLDLHGPWFDTLTWLKYAWLPQAEHLGLRWIAHVVQADVHADIVTLQLPTHVIGKIELQVFDTVPAAEEWLRTCQ